MAEYPGSIWVPSPVNAGDVLTEDMFNDCYAEVVAIESTLGVNPQGAYNSVADRLSAIEGAGGGGGGGIGGYVILGCNSGMTLSSANTWYDVVWDTVEASGGSVFALQSDNTNVRVLQSGVYLFGGRVSFSVSGSTQYNVVMRPYCSGYVFGGAGGVGRVSGGYCKGPWLSSAWIGVLVANSDVKLQLLSVDSAGAQVYVSSDDPFRFWGVKLA